MVFQSNVFFSRINTIIFIHYSTSFTGVSTSMSFEQWTATTIIASISHLFYISGNNSASTKRTDD